MGKSLLNVKKFAFVIKKITKSQLKKQNVIIAKKLARQTKEIDTLIIENPFMGDYHFSVMLGYWLYTKNYNPQNIKLHLGNYP